MQVASCKLQVASCKSKVASCMLQVPAGQFTVKLSAQVDKLPVEQGTTSSARDFFHSFRLEMKMMQIYFGGAAVPLCIKI